MDRKKRQKKALWLALVLTIGILCLSVYYYDKLAATSFIGLNVRNENDQWIITKVQPNGAAEGQVAVGDIVQSIDNKPADDNERLNKWLIIEQASTVTVLRDGQEKSIVFSENQINSQRYIVFLIVGGILLLFLILFTRRQLISRSSHYYLLFLTSVLLAIISIVPSSVGIYSGRFFLIFFVAIFPLCLQMFVSKVYRLEELLAESVIAKLSFSVAVINLTLLIYDRFWPISQILTEYLASGIFYIMALLLLLILLKDLGVKKRQATNLSQVNLVLLSILSFLPLFIFYILPIHWSVPFPLVILFTLLPLMGVFHFLTISKSIAFRYRISRQILYGMLTVLFTVMMVSYVLLSDYIPLFILVIYCALLIYFLMPMITEMLATVKTSRVSDSLTVFNAVEEEREKISIFIHDTVIQDVVYFMREMQEKDQLKKKEVLQTFDEVVFYLRELCSDIYPLMIQELGLQTTLIAMTQQLQKEHPIMIENKISAKEIILSERKNNFVLRSVKELMNNSILHGKAKHISLIISEDSLNYRFEVEDDGTFVEKEGGHEGHFGLKVIREKIELLNGELIFETGNQTSFLLIIPK